jgi:hypothetical protein
MKIKPILFSGQDVRAVFDGWKTQTRRVVEQQPDEDGLCRWAPDAPGVPFSYGHNVWRDTSDSVYRPRYVPGDILWVRETWAGVNPAPEGISLASPVCRPHLVPDPKYSSMVIIYRAEGAVEWTDEDGFMTDRSFWRPSIHMPKWACRLWLRVTDTDVERVRDISEEDAKAEGSPLDCGNTPVGCPLDYCRAEVNCPEVSHRNGFRSLWETRYPGSWERNDWVWVYEFKRCERPEGWPESGVQRDKLS